jgi:hypothetical protein
VASDYEDLFGHQAGSATLMPYVDQLKGGATDESVLAAMLASTDFYASAGGTRSGFVEALYRVLLGRAADPSGLAFWLKELSSGATPSEVAGVVLSSVEYRQDFVTAQYEHFLGRAPDKSELSVGAAALESGTDEAFIAGIAGSAEFYTDAAAGQAA